MNTNNSVQDFSSLPSNTSTDNSTLSLVSETIPGHWNNYQIILTIILGLVTITTISANSLVLYLFWNSTRQRLRSPTHLLLANLAFSDLCVGVIIMPILLTTTVSNLTWYWGDFVCRAFDYIHFPLCASSMVSVIGVITERFIGVKYPLRHRRIMSKGRVKKFIFFIWIFAIILTAVPLTVWPTQDNTNPYVCFLHLKQAFVLFITFGVYWAPVSIMVVLYWLIYRNAVKPFGSVPSGANKKGQSEEAKFVKARQKQTNLTKKMSIFVVMLLLMFGPLFVVFLLRGINSSHFSIHVLIAMGWIRYANSTINPFLYTFAVPGYKAEFYRIFLNENGTCGDDISVTVSETNCTNGSACLEEGGSRADYPSTTVTVTSFSEPEVGQVAKSPAQGGVELQQLNLKAGHPVIPEPLVRKIQDFLRVISEKKIAEDRIAGDLEPVADDSTEKPNATANTE